MLKLRTKTQFTVPSKRGTVLTIVRLIIESIYFDKNNIKVEGYYYYMDTNNEVIKLDSFGANSLLQKGTLDYLEENVLSALSSSNTYQNLKQRAKELTLIQIDQEAPDNYGTIGNDWEEEIEITE